MAAPQEMILKLIFNDDGTFKGLEQINAELQKTNDTAGKTEEAVKSLSKQFNELKKQQEQYKPNTKEFKELTLQMAELKTQMNDAANAVNSNTGPAIEGARASFGMLGEQMMNLDFAGVSQSLNLVSGNLARLKPEDISKGLKSMAEAGVNAFKAVGKAIMANPILAVVGILTAIILNFEKWIHLFPSLENALTGINEQERESLALSKAKADEAHKAYESIDKQSNILKLQGKSEREILNMKIKALEVDIAGRKAQLEITEKQAITQVQTAKRNREILEGIIRFLTAPLQALLGAVDAIAQKLGMDSDLANSFTNMAAGLLIDPQELETELNKTIQENKDAIETMKDDYARLILSVQKMDSDAAKDKADKAAQTKKTADELAAEQLKRDKDRLAFEKATREEMLNEEERLAEEAYQLTLTAQEREIDAVRNKYFELINLAEEGSAQQLLFIDAQAKAEAEINKKYADEEKAAREKKNAENAKELQDLQAIIDAADKDNIMQQYTKQQQELIANDEHYQQLISQAQAAGLDTAALTEEQARKENEIKKKYRDEDKANRMANIQSNFEMASLGLDALMSLNDAAAKGDEASQRKAFNRNKLMQKAQATIAMAAGIVQQLAVPQDQLGGMNFVKAAAIAAAGIANIVKINQTQFGGGGGGGGGGAGANLNAPTGGNNAPALDFSGANMQVNAPGGVETYVLAGNVANALEARQKIIDQSHL